MSRLCFSSQCISDMEVDTKVIQMVKLLIWWKTSVQAKNVTIYWQRWYILALFSLFTMWSCSIWNTFSPIAASAKQVEFWFFLPTVETKVFGWTDSTITLFTLWGTLDFPLFFFPSALLLRKSLRLSVVKKHQLSVVKNRPICARKVCEMILFNDPVQIRKRISWESE